MKANPTQIARNMYNNKKAERMNTVSMGAVVGANSGFLTGALAGAL